MIASPNKKLPFPKQKISYIAQNRSAAKFIEFTNSKSSRSSNSDQFSTVQDIFRAIEKQTIPKYKKSTKRR